MTETLFEKLLKALFRKWPLWLQPVQVCLVVSVVLAMWLRNVLLEVGAGVGRLLNTFWRSFRGSPSIAR